MNNRKATILYITSKYTDATTAAALRAINFVEALRTSGFSVIVATVGPEPALEKVSGNLSIFKVTPSGNLPSITKTKRLLHWPLGRILPGPSPEAKSTKALYRLCSHLIVEHQIDLIFATAPPFSLLSIAHDLSQRYNLPLVLEFRDAWFTGMPWPYTYFLRRRAARQGERQCVLNANHVITVTDAYRQILIDTYGDNLSEKITTVRHGYTRLALETSSKKSSCPSIEIERTFTIAYIGQLRGIDITSMTALQRSFRAINHTLRRCLLGATFCEKLSLDWMSPHHLISGIAQAARDNPDFARSARLIFTGEKFSEINRWARQGNLTDNVRQLGPLPAHEARQLAHNADLLVLTLYGIKDCPYHWCVPSKIYSYLSTGKPILALVPPGEAADLVTKAGTGIICSPTDVSSITKHLLDIFQQYQGGNINLKPNWNFIKQFELPLQQKKFTDTITSVLNHP